MYSAPVTTGKAGYRTPTGTFYIIQRFRVQDMSSANGAAQPYFQPNVEYIQYFYFPGGYALHANYWQPASVFGRANTSHGCVGMLARARHLLLELREHRHAGLHPLRKDHLGLAGRQSELGSRQGPDARRRRRSRPMA